MGQTQRRLIIKKINYKEYCNNLEGDITVLKCATDLRNVQLAIQTGFSKNSEYFREYTGNILSYTWNDIALFAEIRIFRQDWHFLGKTVSFILIICILNFFETSKRSFINLKVKRYRYKLEFTGM